MTEYQTLVVPYDFSAHAHEALDVAIDLARRLGSAQLHLLHVVPLPSYAYTYGPSPMATGSNLDLAAVREDAMRALRELAAEREGLAVKVEPHVVERAAVTDAICDVARELRADLIVMGTHGRTGLAHVFLGSVAERTLRRADCPVLTVRADDDEGAGGREDPEHRSQREASQT